MNDLEEKQNDEGEVRRSFGVYRNLEGEFVDFYRLEIGLNIVEFWIGMIVRILGKWCWRKALRENRIDGEKEFRVDKSE